MVFDQKVSPVDAPERHRFFFTVGTINQVFHVISRHWNSLQIGHRERYSVERLLAFRDYYLRTSPTRVFVVCALTLIPAFTMAILVEFIPLCPPTESWKANYAFWIRLYVTSLPIAFGGVFQVKEVIQPGALSTTGIVATAVGSCTCYVALTMVVAAAWKFPIPFGYVLTIGPFVAFYMIFLLLSIGPRVLAKSSILRSQLLSQMLIIVAQGMLAIAYPTFGAIFNQLSAKQQIGFVFVLPILKFSIKQFIAKAAEHLHEFVGPIVVLSVDVCNVLYVAIVVQTAISPLTTTILIVSDSFFVILALRSISFQTNVAPHRQTSKLLLISNSNYLQDLLAVIYDSFHNVRAEISLHVRIRAPFPLPLSKESIKFMNELVLASQKADVKVRGSKTNSMVSTAWVGRKITKSLSVSNVFSCSQITPSPTHDNMFTRTGSDSTFARSSTYARFAFTHSLDESSDEIAVENVQDSLQALFHSEYVLMAEFVEGSIPVLYAIYLAFLYHLPTAVYYPHTRSLTPEKFVSTQRNIMLYAAVECVSFLMMSIVLRRKFGFSPLYQLAFVFETQVCTIQSHLFVWVLCILQITLVHNGVDLEAPFK